jgi:hypothetical protein
MQFFAAGQLLPAIGLNVKPADNAPTCKEAFYTGSFYTSGLQKGVSVPDFKLYDLNGDSLILSQELSSGKPVLLIAGSLTCPVFRAKVPTINQVLSVYGSSIAVYVIYTLEAHPTDTSVYFGYVNVTSQNTSAGILFNQPLTYGDRKKMVDTLSAFVNLNARIFIDGPCDPWWKTFGPAPNNSYVIGVNGKVLSKHGWFNKSPDNIFCDLDSILGINSALCAPTTTNPGTFSISVINSSITGQPSETIYDYVDLVNTGSVSVNIKSKKLQKSLPLAWQTAFCADICYGVTDDSIDVTIAPFDTIHFSLDFFTSAVADTGSVRVGFKNSGKSNNAYSLRLFASTAGVLDGLDQTEKQPRLIVYPNPTRDEISFSNEVREFRLFELSGRCILEEHNIKAARIDLPDGIYYYTIGTGNGVTTGKLSVQKDR